MSKLSKKSISFSAQSFYQSTCLPKFTLLINSSRKPGPSLAQRAHGKKKRMHWPCSKEMNQTCRCFTSKLVTPLIPKSDDSLSGPPKRKKLKSEESFHQNYVALFFWSDTKLIEAERKHEVFVPLDQNKTKYQRENSHNHRDGHVSRNKNIFTFAIKSSL